MKNVPLNSDSNRLPGKSGEGTDIVPLPDRGRSRGINPHVPVKKLFRRGSTARHHEGLTLGEFFSHLVHITPHMVVRFDRDLHKTIINRAVGEYFALSTSAMSGQVPMILGGDAQDQVSLDLLENLFETGETREVEHCVLMETGPHYFRTRVIPERESQGKVESILAVSMDITPQRCAAGNHAERHWEPPSEVELPAFDRLSISDSINQNIALQIILSVKDGIVAFDPHFNYIFWNPVMEKLTGVPMWDVLGKNAFSLFPFFQEQGIDRYLRRALAGETVIPPDFLASIPQTGKRNWICATYSPLRDADGRIVGVIGIISDINERKQAEQDLQESHQKLEKLFEILPIGVSILDANGKVTKSNTTLDQILGTSADFLKTEKYRERRYFRTDGTPMPKEEFASTRVINGEEKVLHVKTGVEKEDGQLVWLDVSAVVGPSHDWSTIIALNDISKLKLAEDDIRLQIATVESLLRTSAILNAQLDLDTLLRMICREAATALHAPGAWVNLYDQNQDSLVFAADFGLSPEFKTGYLPVSLNELSGMVGKSKSAIVIQDINTGSKLINSSLFVAQNIQTIALMGLINEEQTIGTIGVVTYKKNREYTPEELNFLQGFANQAALAIRNANLFEQVSASSLRMRNLSQALIELQESERRNLALELHDQLGQIISSAKISLDMVPLLDQTAANEQLRHASDLLDDLISRVRRISLGLRPSMLDDMGLLPALLWLIRNYRTHGPNNIHFFHEIADQRFVPQVEIAAFRIAQEALTNVLRHAGKTQVNFNIWTDEKSLYMQIVDYGVGFDLNTILARSDAIGLSGMRERARLLGGDLVIETAPGAGTSLTARLPILPS